MWLFNFIISLKIFLVKKHFLNMFRNTIFLLSTLFLISCKKPKDKIEDLLNKQTIKRFGTFEDIINVIDFFIDDRSSFITGQIIYLGGVNN